MEEQQIKDFVGRISADETLRAEVAANPAEVMRREGLGPRVAQVLMRVVPQLALDQPTEELFTPSLRYW